MKKFLEHLLYWKESYVLPFIVLCVLILSIHFVGYLTGRPVVEDPNAIVGFLLNCVGMVIAISLTGFAQNALFGYRSNGKAPKIWDDVYDAVVTFLLLFLFTYRLFH